MPVNTIPRHDGMLDSYFGGSYVVELFHVPNSVFVLCVLCYCCGMHALPCGRLPLLVVLRWLVHVKL